MTPEQIAELLTGEPAKGKRRSATVPPDTREEAQGVSVISGPTGGAPKNPRRGTCVGDAQSTPDTPEMSEDTLPFTQFRGPCKAGAVTLEGGCWRKVEAREGVCPRRTFVHRGCCYSPVLKPQFEEYSSAIAPTWDAEPKAAAAKPEPSPKEVKATTDGTTVEPPRD